MNHLIITGNANLDFSDASIVLPDGMTIQVRSGNYDELQTITLLNAELGYTTDTQQLFVGDGTTVGGLQLGVRRYRNSITPGAQFTDLLGTPTERDIVYLAGNTNEMTLLLSPNRWIPLVQFKDNGSGDLFQYGYGRGILLFTTGGDGTVAGSGIAGHGGILDQVLVVTSGAGGNNVSGASGNGGGGGTSGQVLLFLAGSGGTANGPAAGGFGGSIVEFIYATAGNGGGGYASNGGAGGKINTVFRAIAGNGGAGGSVSGALGGDAGSIVGSIVLLQSGNGGVGGSSPGANGGTGGSLQFNSISVRGGSGGAGGGFAGGVGGFGGRLNLVGAAGGAGSGSSAGGTGGDAGLLQANGGAGSTNGGNGGAAGQLLLNGGAAASGFNGGAGGTINLAGAGASGTQGIVGGNITLNNGTNTMRTSAATPRTVTLPTVTADSRIETVTVMTWNQTGAITFNSNGQNETIYNSSGSSVASATITLPATSIPGQVLRYVAAGALTSITMAGAGVVIGAAPTSLSAGAVLVWQCTVAGSYVRLQ